MNDPKDLRRGTPMQSRVVERRLRTRAGRVPSEMLPLALLAETVVLAGRLIGRGFTELGDWLSLPQRPALRHLPPENTLTPLRVRGTLVARGPSFETPGSPSPVLFARTIFVNREHPGQPRTISDELRGSDLAIRLPSGELLEISAQVIRLSGIPRRIPAPNLAELARRGGDHRSGPLFGLPSVREQSVAEGDTVEAVGLVVREVAPAGDAAFGRGTPLVARLVPRAHDRHIYLHKLARR